MPIINYFALLPHSGGRKPACKRMDVSGTRLVSDPASRVLCDLANDLYRGAWERSFKASNLVKKNGQSLESF